MGQTLSYGVYLPNEGERNCYAGLASNWQILNTAVGNIAEKAPLVHTHGNISNDGKVGTTANLPLITGTGGVVQAGSFGTTSGTFCEGNDSRLSDARTPVAHTHTKSDVTGLLNSNFIPSANNSYDLGSSSYQWKSVYANRTYTSTIKAATGNLIIQSTGTDKSVAIYNGTLVGDGGGIWLYGKDHANGSKVRLQIYNTTTSGFEGVDLSNSSLYPMPNNLLNLGTSTNRWKTLNGINPGALSLPDTLGTSGTENVNYFNVIGYLNNTGTLATIPSTATYDGWLYINAKDGADSYILIDDSPSGFGSSVYGNNGLGAQGIGLLCLICPIRKGHYYNVRIKSAGIVSARIYPAQGNV